MAAQASFLKGAVQASSKRKLMKNQLPHVLLAALTTLTIGGCLAEDPVSDSDPTSDPDQAPAASPPELSARIAAVAATASNYHQLVNLQYNQCMDAPNGTLNVQLQLTNCLPFSSLTSYRWAFVAAGPANTFYLVNQRSGFCAEVNNGTARPGELVDQWHCDGSTAEQWVQSFRVIDGVTYQQFTHAGTGLCLDTVGSAGSKLMQWTCGGGNDAQTWLVR
jgi:hypothetical protein